MKAFAATLLLLLCAEAAAADDCAPYAQPKYLRFSIGTGHVPKVDGASLGITTDFAMRSFGGAFSSGLSSSFETAIDGRWFVSVPGLFLQVDLMWIILSHLWSRHPPDDFPVRLHVGGRVGIAFSQSIAPVDAEPFAPPYFLVRPEAHAFVGIEVPFDATRSRSFVVRAAIDGPLLQVTEPFRWSISAGLSIGWRDD